MSMESNDVPARLSRREILARGAAGAVAAASLSTIAALAETPSPGMTEGPYWVDEMLNRSDIREDPSTGQIALGFPLRLTICVSKLDADGKPTPLPGAIVDIWHCNALGIYSDVSAQNTVGQKFLRGYQVTNARGLVRFTTIYPGWYSGRTVHIHVRVRVYDEATDTVTYNQVSQLFFEDELSDLIHILAPYDQHPNRDTYNATDDIFASDSDDDGQEDGQQLMVLMSTKSEYATATANFYLDLTDGNGNGDDTGLNQGPTDGGDGMPPGDGGTPPDGSVPPDGGFPPDGTPPDGAFPPGGTPPDGVIPPA